MFLTEEVSHNIQFTANQWFWIVVILIICITIIWVTWLIAVARKEAEKD